MSDQEMSNPLSVNVSRYRAPALDKGLDIIELLADQPNGLTRAEIVKAMGRSQSEIYRMLERLVARDYVTRSLEGDRYALSLKMFVLSQKHLPLNRLIAQALPVMDVFAKFAGQSCHLGVHDKGIVTIIAQVNSPGSWGLSTHLGAQLDLVETGSGGVLLAFQNEAARAQMIDMHRARAGIGKIDEQALADKYDVIRQQGYWQGDSRQCYGVIDISCAICDCDGAAIAVLTCPYIRRLDGSTGSAITLDEAQQKLMDICRMLSFQ